MIIRVTLSTAMRAGRAFWACALLFVGCQVAAAPGLIPLEDFFRWPVVSGPVSSPSGKYVAATMTGGPKGRQRLVILNLEDIARSKVLAGSDDLDIVDVDWVNEDRLIFQYGDLQRAAGEPSGSGLMSIDRDGTLPVRRLIELRHSLADVPSNARVLWANDHALHSVIHDGSNDVIVKRFRGNANNLINVTLLRMDTATGRTRVLTSDAPDRAQAWAVDTLGNPRATMTHHQGTSTLYWKATPQAAWALIREFDTFRSDGQALTPLLVSSDGFLYAAGRSKPGNDTSALLRRRWLRATWSVSALETG